MENSISLDLSVKSAIIFVFVTGILTGIIMGGLGMAVIQDGAGQETSTTAGTAPGPEDTASPSQDSEKKTVPVESITYKDDPVLGNPDAEITMVYWGDFNCMFCYRFAQQTFPKVRQNFVESGDVKVVYKNLVTMGPDSVTLAKASQAAWKMVGEENSGLYWKWHEQLSADQKERKSNSEPVMKDILATTEKIEGIDASKLQQEIARISEDEINEDIQQARKRGITGTPGFVVYRSDAGEGLKIVGAQPYSVFENKVKTLLNE